MKLIFIKDEKQVEQLHEIAGHNDSSSVIIPIMPKAAVALRELPVQGIKLPIEYLDIQERNSIYQEAIDLSRSWGDSFKDRMIYKEIDLLDCTGILMLSFFQDVIAAEKIIPRIIEQYKPKTAVFLNEPAIPSIGHQAHDGTSDIGISVFQWRLKQAGVEIIIHKENQEEGRIIKKILPARAQRILKKVKHKISNNLNKQANSQTNSPVITQNQMSPGRISLPDISKEKPVVIGHGSGYDLLVIWPYIKAIAKEVEGVPVLLNILPDLDSSTKRSGLSIDEDLRYIYTNDIPYPPEDDFDISTIRNEVLNGLHEGTLLPHVLRNPLLQYQFDIFLGFLESTKNAVFQAYQFMEEYPVALYLDDYSADPVNRAWTAVANNLNIPSVTAPHGAVNLLEFHEFNAQFAFAWGELGKENLVLSNPGKEEQVIVAGDPSMTELSMKSIAAEKRNKVLLITGGFLQQMWTDMDLERFFSAWNNIVEIAKKQSSMEFIIKPHPSVRDFGNWYRSFVDKSSVANIKVIDTVKLEELLPEAFLAVLVGKPGTAGLVSSLYEVPLLYYDTMLCRNVTGYNIWNDGNGIPYVTNSDDLGMLIEAVYSNAEERDKIIEQNRNFSKRYLHEFQPDEICKNILIL
ncbi:MAG: hypothetical protein GY754_33355 [bacterium]|nr:hypothetical protein [bacterium]